MPDAGKKTGGMGTRVLIVGYEAQARFAVERRLRKADVETTSASSVRHAIERLRNDAYDAVLCDLRIAGGDAPALVQWLGSYSPSTRVIVAAGESDEFRTEYAGAPGLTILGVPLDVEELATLVDELGPRRGFFGNSIEVELFDYVQMIALSGRDKLVEIQTPSGNGLIWFEHGDIVHCDYDQYRGETAFYKLLAVNRGTFQEVLSREPPMRTVTRSSTHLLMEAARQSDEGILGDVVDSSGQSYTKLKIPDSESSFEELNLEDAAAANSLDAPAILPSAPPFAEHTPPMIPIGPLDSAKTGKFKPAPLLEDTDLPDSADSMMHGVVPLLMPAGTDVGSAKSTGPSDEEAQAAMSTVAGHAIFDDPDMRNVMLEQFWQFEGINGVAIISSTGKVLAEDMRSNSSLVTLAGFYMRGAARIARTLGHNVFDGVVARSVNGQQMVMVSMGAASAVLSVEPGADPERVRDAVMGIE